MAFCISFSWKDWEFWDAYTDTVFTWLELLHVEQVTKRQLRYNQPATVGR